MEEVAAPLLLAGMGISALELHVSYVQRPVFGL